MEDDVLTVNTKGFDIREFTKFYAEALLELWLTHRDEHKALSARLGKEVDKMIQEVSIHNNGEVHIYFMDRVILEYSAEELGKADRFGNIL